MRILILCVCLGLLAACATESSSVRYYLLHTPEDQVSTVPDKTKPTTVLQVVEVADYLQQSSLVMQVDQHELYYSREDVWAEKLQLSFYKALLLDLNALGQRNYVAFTAPDANEATSSISIKLAHFHATGNSTVVSSGRYWLSSINQENQQQILPPVSYPFFFESELQQDGYAQAVKQLRTLVTSLARQIDKEISASSNK